MYFDAENIFYSPSDVVIGVHLKQEKETCRQ